MRLKLLASATLVSALMTNAYALEIGKPVVSTVPVTDAATLAASNNSSLTKEVYLMGLNLTPQQVRHIQTPHPFKALRSEDLPAQVQLGMNNTPVLDQGRHGSCVTFAISGAYDALIGKGDYVSQLCSLELGKYLEANGYLWSGWDGSWGNIVFAQFNAFGMIAKSHEKDKICGGLDSYPASAQWQTGQAMEASAYKKISEDVSQNYYFEPILTASESMNDTSYPLDRNAVLESVKKELYQGSKDGSRRIAFGVIIPYRHGMTGACGTFHKTHDTWSYSNEIKNDPNPALAGHEMIITGYDDNAVATDADGLQHKGLLTLRNSWGSKVGDNGDFYMSYDFFTQYVLEAHTLAKA